MKPSYTQAFNSIANCSIGGIGRQEVLLITVKKQKNIPLFHSEIGFTFGWVFIREGKLFICRVRKNENYSACMLRKAEQTLLRLWFLLLDTNKAFRGISYDDAMAIFSKEMPKNHTDKECFAAASSCIETGILTLLFPHKRRRSSPSPFISHCVLEAVASRILRGHLTLKWTKKFV